MDELGKSFPAAEGMVDAEQSGPPGRNNEFCLNCGTKLLDAYCQHCGQKDIPRRQTLGELWINFISSFWSYEGKFFLTTKYLVTKPGFLAIEYNAGKRESYYHPARMYVFISFVFFLLFFSLPDEKKDATKLSDDIDLNIDDLEESPKLDKARLDSILQKIPGHDSTLNHLARGLPDSVKRDAKAGKNKRWSSWRTNNAEYKSIHAYDSVQLTKPEKDRDGWLARRVVFRAIELSDKYNDDAKKFADDFGIIFKDSFSKILFYLLPIFALLLKFLYVRRDYFYSEHLVFSIYYYNFFYLAGSMQMLVNLIPGLGWLGTLMGFWILFYLLFAMKRMYGQRWRKTIFKFVLFVIAFFFFALVGVSVSALVTLMII